MLVLITKFGIFSPPKNPQNYAFIEHYILFYKIIKILRTLVAACIGNYTKTAQHI